MARDIGVNMTQQTPLIFGKMIELVRKIGAIDKTYMSGVKYSARSIDDILDACNRVFGEVGVFTTTRPLNVESRTVETRGGGSQMHYVGEFEVTFWAEDGSSVSTVVGLDGAGQLGKARAGAESNAWKYAIIRALSIPIEGVEDSEDNVPPQESVALAKLLDIFDRLETREAREGAKKGFVSRHGNPRSMDDAAIEALIPEAEAFIKNLVVESTTKEAPEGASEET